MSNNFLKILNDTSFNINVSKKNITVENFEHVFEEWKELAETNHDVQVYVSTFLDDIQKDISEQSRMLSSKNQHLFWNKYNKVSNVLNLIKHKDRLVELWSRRKDGEFFTPLFYSELAHQYIQKYLKQDTYLYNWWDMCCGTGNLTKPCPEFQHNTLYLSTLNDEDIQILQQKTLKNTVLFSQDFLNSNLDYEFLNSKKDWVFILNPPYTASATVRDSHKHRVANTSVGDIMRGQKMNKAASNLTTQFLWKILELIKKYNINVTIGMFTQISFAMNPSYKQFYDEWLSVVGFVDGFCFHCSEFEGTTGEWPVVFSLWSTQIKNNNVTVDIYHDRQIIGQKSFKAPNFPLSKWIDRPKNIIPAVPFTSAITIADSSKTINLTKLPDRALGFAVFAANDVMHSKQSYILSMPYANGSGWGITPDNFENSLVAVGSRAIIKGTWLNDRDQFNTPDIASPMYQQFKNDMIIWLLFSNFNHCSGLNIFYENKSIHIINHMFWRNSSFVHEWMQDKTFSIQANDLIVHCNVFYEYLQRYKSYADSVYQLDRVDAGWYQWRKALTGQKAPNKSINDMYTQYKRKHKELSNLLIPQIYDLGILPQETIFHPMKNSKKKRLYIKHEV